MSSEFKPETLFVSPGGWITVKLHHQGRFCYVERKGIDSVAIVLISECRKFIGLIREGKPPHSDRLNSEMPLLVSALGGSLFDRVHSDREWALMTNDERIHLAKETAKDETKEELGYTSLKTEFVGINLNNSMSNERIYGVVCIVDMYEDTIPNPQSTTEALARPHWFPVSNLDNLECGKAKAILFDLMTKTNILNLKE